MSFSQDISKILDDSKLLESIDYESNEDLMEEIKNFVTNEEFTLIDRFYQDYTQFNLEDSIKLVNILHKFNFKQEEDFDMLTIFKFKLLEFNKSYEKEHLFKIVKKKKINEDGEITYVYSEVNKLNVCCMCGFFLTFKYYYNTEKIRNNMRTAISHEQLNIAKYIYDREYSNVELSKKKKLLIDLLNVSISNDKVNSLRWIMDLNILTNQDINYELVLTNINTAKYLYSVDQAFRDYLIASIPQISDSANGDVLEWIICDLQIININALAFNDIIGLFRISYLEGNVRLVKKLLELDTITDEFLNNEFYNEDESANPVTMQFLINSRRIRDNKIIEAFNFAYDVGDEEMAELLYNTGIVNSPSYTFEKFYETKGSEVAIHYMDNVSSEIISRVVSTILDEKLSHSDRELLIVLMRTNRFPNVYVENILDEHRTDRELIFEVLKNFKIKSVVLDAILKDAYENDEEMFNFLIQTKNDISRELSQILKEEYINNNNISFIDMIFSLYTGRLDLGFIFKFAYEKNDLNMVDKLIKSGKLENVSEVFELAYEKNDLDIVDKLMKFGKIQNISRAFEIAYEREDIIMINFLIDNNMVNPYEMGAFLEKSHIDKNMTILNILLGQSKIYPIYFDKVFSAACHNKDVELVVKILKTGKISDMNIITSFAYALIDKNKDIAQILSETGKINDELIERMKLLD